MDCVTQIKKNEAVLYETDEHKIDNLPLKWQTKMIYYLKTSA